MFDSNGNLGGVAADVYTVSGSKKGATPAADSKENNIVGKLNNLVTTDINALEGGTTFILVGE